LGVAMPFAPMVMTLGFVGGGDGAWVPPEPPHAKVVNDRTARTLVIALVFSTGCHYRRFGGSGP
jgi:hypothetical protein